MIILVQDLDWMFVVFKNTVACGSKQQANEGRNKTINKLV
jgi:hypothetical protein